MSNNKSKNKKINMYLLIVLLVISIGATAVFAFNIVSVAIKKDNAGGTTVGVDSNSNLKNDDYSIGNNPTQLTQTYFKELTAAMKEDDPLLITDAVVKCFVSDYFTWTNKDGNYEVGGLQYIFGSKYIQFSEESRWKMYKDLDLYIEQYGRENLLEVESVETTDPVYAGEYTIGDETMDAYYVEATWTYKKSSKIDVDSFQKLGYFTVVDHDGRYEIVQFYDK